MRLSPWAVRSCCFIAAVVGYVNRSVDVVLNGQETAVRVGSTLQNLIDDQELTDTYDAGDLLAADDSVLTRHGGEKLSVKWTEAHKTGSSGKSRELTGGEKVTVKDGRNTYEKHEVQATVIEPKLKVEGTGAISMCRHGVSRAAPRCGSASSRVRRKTAARLCPPPIASLRAPAWRPRATKSTWR